MSKNVCLSDLWQKKRKLIVGLNSGTSADGVDAALIEVVGNGMKSRVKFLAGSTYFFSAVLQRKIRKYMEPEFDSAYGWLQLDAELANHFARAVISLLRRCHLSRDRIALIGSHGQTIRHLPNEERPVTCQLADPGRIAVLTGITTVGDFRIADVAAGGQGAPITPIANAVLFGRLEGRTAVLNIGGIANITVLPDIAKGGRIFGCDTGPGCMVIDYLAQRLFGRRFDRDGRLAYRGMVDRSLVRQLLRARFYAIPGPKSTGRERYGRTFSELLIQLCRRRGLSAYDIIATASYYTAAAVAKCISVNRLRFDRLILTGDGSRNLFVADTLKEVLPNIEIGYADHFGYPRSFLEAISFAILANEALHSNRYDLSLVTGSRRAVVLGKICQP